MKKVPFGLSNSLFSGITLPCEQEGMRVAYPGIAPALGTREAMEDFQLGKWFIPKGSAGRLLFQIGT